MSSWLSAGHCYALRSCGDTVAPQAPHELQHGGLSQHVLQNDAVGMEKQIALARLDFLVFRVVKVTQQNLIRQGQRPASRRRTIVRLRSIVS
jgi:hypothetical protein